MTPITQTQKLIACPECLKRGKSKHFKNDTDVNRHLQQKHKAPYNILILEHKTLYISRMRQKALSSNTK